MIFRIFSKDFTRDKIGKITTKVIAEKTDVTEAHYISTSEARAKSFKNYSSS